MNEDFYEIDELICSFKEKEKDKYIKRQAELGLKSPQNIDRSMWTDDEFEAWYYIMCDKSVPEELREKILSVQHWELPLYQILFDIYDEMEERNKKRERSERDEYGQEIYVEGSKLHHWYLTSMKSRSYLKMHENEKERLKQLQERFLAIFGIYSTNLSIQTQKIFHDEIELHSVKVPVMICNKMEKKKISFQGYITLDDVEHFIQKEEQELRMEHKMVVTFEDLKENKDLIVQIANKLVKENVIQEKSSEFFKVLRTLKFVPVTNLRKILGVNLEGYQTFSKWLQEMKKRELLQFSPYIHERGCPLGSEIVLSYDTFFSILSDGDYAGICYANTDGFLSPAIFEEYKVYDESSSYLKSSEGYYYTRTSYWFINLCEEKMKKTRLSQAIYYMWLMNIGNISMEFQAMMRKKEGRELFDYFVHSSAKKEMFQTFDVTFETLNEFISKKFYLFWDCSEFCILEKEEEVGDIKDKECFRIPATNNDYDLCRVVVYSSLKVAIEHDSGQREVIILDLEPLLEQISFLEEKEKQEILTNIGIKILVITFGLNLANIGICHRTVYAMQSLSIMRKWDKELPVVCNLNDLYDIV